MTIVYTGLFILGVDFEYDIKSEEKMCSYGVCILLIQAGKYGLIRDEFEDYVKQLGWDEEKQSAIGEIYEENRDRIRSLFFDSTVFLPRLINIECELMDPNAVNAGNTSTLDFTSIISYYIVTFIYKDLDGEVRSLSKCLNTIQLHKLIDTIGDAIHQCDQFVKTKKEE